MSRVTVEDVQYEFELELYAGKTGLHRTIDKSDISRPGLEMAGYFKYYISERIQLLGISEVSFFSSLSDDEKIERANKLCTKDTPAIIISHGMEVPIEFIQAGNKNGVPVLKTDIPTTRFSGMLTNFLEGQLASMITMHGVLVDVYGIGVLLTGESGVGKSETALELVKRGHRLVADDLVEIREVAKNVLIGNSPKLIEHMMEIRGVGVIDLMNLFGASAVKSDKRILLVIDLEIWDPDKTYERLGLDENKVKIMDTEVTRLVVPVRPGRNLSVIIEVAAMDFRMKSLGINAAQKFNEKLNQAIEDSTEVNEKENN